MPNKNVVQLSLSPQEALLVSSALDIIALDSKTDNDIIAACTDIQRKLYHSAIPNTLQRMLIRARLR